MAVSVPTNLPPTAEAGGPYSGAEGSVIPVNASASQDSDGTISLYEWDWNNDGTYDFSSATPGATHTWSDNGVFTVGLRVTDDDDSAATDTTSVTVSNVAPTSTLGNDGPKDEGTAVRVSFGSVIDPGSADTFTYSFDWNNDGTYDIVDQADSYADHAWSDDGVFTVKAMVKDDDGGSNEYTTSVTVSNANPTSDGEPENQTTQYSDPIDPIRIEATDVSTDDLTASTEWKIEGAATFTGGLFGDLTLSGPVKSDNGDGTSTTEWTIDGIANVAAGTYVIRITVNDEDGGTDYYDVTVVVAKEDADMTSDNPVAKQVTAPGGVGPVFTITVTLMQDADGHLGDLDLIAADDLQVALKPVGGGSGPTITVAKTGPGVFNLSVPGLAVETYSLEVTLDNEYFVAPKLEDVLSIFDPSLGFASGGGWFYWPGTTDKTNFGFTMKYNKKATNVQGSLLLIRHLADGTIYRVKSNMLGGLALSAPTTFPGWATFSGKCTYVGPDAADNTGGQQFLVRVTDGNNPGNAADTFWFAVVGRQFSLDGNGNKQSESGEAVSLSGGNIVVPHTATGSAK